MLITALLQGGKWQRDEIKFVQERVLIRANAELRRASENKVAPSGGEVRECSSYLMKIAARVEYEKRAYESVGNKRDGRRVEQDGQEPLVDLEL